MTANKQAAVILLAAGKAARYSGEAGNDSMGGKEATYKQFALLRGKPLISYSLKTFCASSLVDKIIIMVPPGMEAKCQQIIDELPSFITTKVAAIKAGGKSRFDSVNLSLGLLEEEDAQKGVLIHDAARPLVSLKLVEESITALQSYAAVAPAYVVTDTLGYFGKQTTSDREERSIIKTLPRSDYCLLQTPQGFHFQLLKESFRRCIKRAMEKGEDTARWSDDCSVVLDFDSSLSIKIIQGEQANIKLTYKEDMQLLESILDAAPERKI